MKIICIGRNYAQHAKELNNPLPVKPLYFLKPDTALLINNDPFYYPNFSSDIHYECELIFRINKVGKNIQEKFAHKYYSEIGLGIDFTARDIQQTCKEKGHPWEIAKGFDGSAAISKFIPLEELKNKETITFELEINQEKVQIGNSSDMIFSIDQIISYVSQFMTLKTGDIIFTGTPAGVGSLKIGDQLKGTLEGNLLLDFEIK